MASSSNTFGTFLETWRSLDQGSASTPQANNVPAAETLLSVVKDVARGGGEKPIKDIVASLGQLGAGVLPAVLEGRKQGLLEFSETNGEALAKLTTLGKAFAE